MLRILLILSLVFSGWAEMDIIQSDDYLNFTSSEGATLNFDIYGFYDYPYVSLLKKV